MYKYALIYTLRNMQPYEVQKEIIIFADDRAEALEMAMPIIKKAIEENRVEPTCGAWAKIGNSKGKIVAWLVGNYAMGGLRWEQKGGKNHD